MSYADTIRPADRAEPQPGALKGCGAPNPDRWSYGHEKCMEDARGWRGGRPRACVVDGAHIHSWARPDMAYCSTRCRMKALRARKAAAKAKEPAAPLRQPRSRRP